MFEGKKILISSWNVNGLRAFVKKPHFKKYMKDNSPDIICFNETKINLKTLSVATSNPNFDSTTSSYTKFWNFSSARKGYSGTSIFSKVPPIAITFGIGNQEHDLEGRVITAEFDKFFLVASYVPNAGRGLTRLDYRVEKWDVDLAKYLEGLKVKKGVIWCGDLNVAHKDIDIYKQKGMERCAGFTPQERKNFGKFLKQGWVDTFRHFNPGVKKFSYFSLRSDARAQNRGWRLDYFVVNKELLPNVISSEILSEIEGSDHVPLECVLEF